SLQRSLLHPIQIKEGDHPQLGKFRPRLLAQLSGPCREQFGSAPRIGRHVFCRDFHRVKVVLLQIGGGLPFQAVLLFTIGLVSIFFQTECTPRFWDALNSLSRPRSPFGNAAPTHPDTWRLPETATYFDPRAPGNRAAARPPRSPVPEPCRANGAR